MVCPQPAGLLSLYQSLIVYMKNRIQFHAFAPYFWGRHYRFWGCDYIFWGRDYTIWGRHLNLPTGQRCHRTRQIWCRYSRFFGAAVPDLAYDGWVEKVV